MEKEIRSDNPLGYVPENKLLRQFAIPSIIAMLVSSLYNIVDQFFIGNAVGELGNAATNIAFPLNTSCVAIALLMGIGGASTFNLSMGRGDSKGAGKYIGNSATVMLVLGVVLSAVTLLFLAPLLRFFGSPEEVLPYAMEYTRITALGFPFLILSTGGGHLVRADGSPCCGKYSSGCHLCLWFWLGYDRSRGCNRDWTGHCQYHGYCLSVTL